MARPPNEFHIYCDESHTEHRFMVFGGIVIPSRDLEKFDALVNAWRVKNNMTAELKWTKLTDQRFDMYRSLIDLFFSKASSNRDGFHFKAAVYDMSQVNYRRQFGGNKELGFYNFYRFFLLHKFGQYAKTEQHKLYIFVDERSTKYRLSHLRKSLNDGIRKKLGHPIDVVFSVAPLDSKKSNLMQIADVLMGAVGWTVNGKLGSRRARSALVDHIVKKAHVGSLNPGDRGHTRFNIWQIDLKRKGSPGT